MPQQRCAHELSVAANAQSAATTCSGAAMNKDFLRLWLGQTVSVCGTKMTQFAMALWLFSETGLASALALSNLSQSQRGFADS